MSVKGRIAPVALFCLAVAGCAVVPTPAERAREFFIDIGTAGDQAFVGKGFYGREGPNPRSKSPFFRGCNFRWSSNEFELTLPTIPRSHNEVRLRVFFGGPMKLEIDPDWCIILFGEGIRRTEYDFVIPAEKIGNRRKVKIRGYALLPRKPTARDKRTLFAAFDWVKVRTTTDYRPQQSPPPERPLSELPVTERLRGVEFRPPVYDAKVLALQMRHARANVVTIGVIDGKGYANYPTELAAVNPRMQPRYIADAITELHRNNIAVISWVLFNIQDVRNPDDYVIIKRFPQYAMKYIAGAEPSRGKHVGMCVVSSPYIEEHAKLLREIARFDLDALFFDGVFFQGKGTRPSMLAGCTCDYCREAFHKDTGLELPRKVDWRDMTFKRWVRWRNQRMLRTMRYFKREIQKVNPRIEITYNWNMWPFGNKDWETGLPLWKIDEFGVSQHCHSGKLGEQWVMLGFKARLSHDMNPRHCDIWRPSSPVMFKSKDTPEDRRRHEDILKTTMLAGLTYGVVPWMGGISPATRAAHDAVAERERYWSRNQLRHIGVLISHNTHDFYGHIPETENLLLYRDGILGTFLLLSDNHLQFEFIFDNQVEAGNLDGFEVIILPNAAAMSEKAAESLRKFVEGGGLLVCTFETSLYDEWGEKRKDFLLGDLLGISARDYPHLQPVPEAGDIPPIARKKIGKGTAVYLPFETGVAYARERRRDLAKILLDLIAERPQPIEIIAPRNIASNLMWSTDGRSIYVHLLNISILVPNGESEFRGLGRPPAHSPDLKNPVAEAGKIGMKTIPVTNIKVKPNGTLKVRAARLAVSGEKLRPNADGFYIVPEVHDHEIFILDLQT